MVNENINKKNVLYIEGVLLDAYKRILLRKKRQPLELDGWFKSLSLKDIVFYVGWKGLDRVIIILKNVFGLSSD